MFYSTSQVCQIFDVSASTLKNWCELARPFLSELATPPKSKHRSFTSEDLRVFAVIKTSPDYDSAYLTLSNGARSDPPSGHNDYSVSMQPREQVMLLQTRILQLEGENERLKAYEQETIELRALMRHNQNQLNELQNKLEKLIAENAVLKSKLDE